MLQLPEWWQKQLGPESEFSPEDVQRLREIAISKGYEVPQFVPPSLARKAGNFLAASTKHVVSGFRNVPKEVQEARYAICKACPGGHYKPQGDSCRLCGCIMATKTVWATAACPDRYWSNWKEGDEPPKAPISSFPDPLQPQPTATASQTRNEPPQISSSSPEEPGQQP